MFRYALKNLLVGRRFCNSKSTKINEIPTLKQFLSPKVATKIDPISSQSSTHYDQNQEPASPASYYLETYGCQMNENDSQIVRSLLHQQNYHEAQSKNNADIVLINTCAIREAAEQKIHNRIKQLKSQKRVIGILGCMAERIRERMFNEGVHVVCGPDAYRDLPRLLEMALRKQNSINVQLSFEETYADVAPIRKNINNVTAFLSVMRGCNNMCSFCIVPFVRGRERSRDLQTILKEIEHLQSQGVREITFLGQNVNSYHDTSATNIDSAHRNSSGFSETYKLRNSPGYRFQHLLENAAKSFPNIRFRFTSPHPKDFPESLLQKIAMYPNLCNNIHLPAQSGNTQMLYRMRRNHSRQSYYQLVKKIRQILPDIGLSTDLMCGFCGQTQQQFADTISLIQQIKYDNAFLFAYSMREKTHAHRRYQDDIPDNIKKQRLRKMVDTFQSTLTTISKKQLHKDHLVLIEKPSKRDKQVFTGRTDNYKKAYLSSVQILPVIDKKGQVVGKRTLKIGDFVGMEVLETGNRKLLGEGFAIYDHLSGFSEGGQSRRKQLKNIKKNIENIDVINNT